MSDNDDVDGKLIFIAALANSGNAFVTSVRLREKNLTCCPDYAFVHVFHHICIRRSKVFDSS
jgi:hypothetical protein